MRFFQFLVHAYDVYLHVYMRIRSWFQPEVEATTLFGARVRCRPRDFIQRRIALFGLFEPNLTCFMAAVLKPGDVFVDVGANIGYFSMLASGRVGASGKVCAIEACPGTHDQLVANLQRNGMTNVAAFNMAVMDTDCHIRIQPVDWRNIGANRVEVIAAPEAGSVVGRPLRDIVGPDLDRARLIKVDVEGAEHRILPALFDHFAKADNPPIIVSEIAEDNAGLIALARSKGFAVRGLRNDYSFSYLMLRAQLHRMDDGAYFVLRDVDSYLSTQYDYVFCRPAVVADPGRRNRARAEISVLA